MGGHGILALKQTVSSGAAAVYGLKVGWDWFSGSEVTSCDDKSEDIPDHASTFEKEISSLD
nr:uncharacterized protein CI109_003372 [Kwoniella shandongensis]KAA5528084.1 hypothetical protein CI109_003372 [Kwoniella shandongensis]